MRIFTNLLGEQLDKPVAQAQRRPGARSKYDFVFSSAADERTALEADRLIICEDVVTTLGSVAAMRRLLRPEQTVHSLAMLRRGEVNPAYKGGLVDHYLVEREISLD